MKNFRSYYTFNILPWFADLQARLATSKARRMLSRREKLTLLIDSQIHHHAITHEGTWIDTGTVLAAGKFSSNTGYIGRVSVYSKLENSREYKDICFLTGLTYLAINQHLSMFTSRELMAEQDRQPPKRIKPVGYADLSLLSRVNIKPIDDWSTDAIINWPSRTGVSLEQFQLNRINLSQDETFLKIWKILGGGRKTSLDAWHLRTAHIYQLSGILTMDYKLEKMWSHNKNKLFRAGITVKIWTPSSLGTELCILPQTPNMLAYNGDGFPVQNDVYLRDGQVRKKRN